jgi:hypothetical protein
MAGKQVQVRGKKKASKKKIAHIHIEPADNGYVSEVHYKPPESANNRMGNATMPMPPGPERKVHETGESLMAHLGSLVGGTSKPSADDRAGSTQVEDPDEPAEA